MQKHCFFFNNHITLLTNLKLRRPLIKHYNFIYISWINLALKITYCTNLYNYFIHFYYRTHIATLTLQVT
jgi:hypothetical protein